MGSWLQTQYQELLESLLHELFPRLNIFSNTKKPASITSPAGKYLEIDVRIPEINVCFEFQDYYHYKPAWYSQLPLHVIQQTDHRKRLSLMCDHQTLVVIPCWWCGATSSLQSSIYFQRPDLCTTLNTTEDSKEIPFNPPFDFFAGGTALMLASFPPSLTAASHADTSTVRPLELHLAQVLSYCAEWWVGEKWDGVRCLWDATAMKLYSRNKAIIDLQSTAHNLFGNLVLDSELWCGRGFYNELHGILSAGAVNLALIRVLCFDEASTQMQTQPFEKRYATLISLLPVDHPRVINAARVLCDSVGMLQGTIHAVGVAGGEGVVLRRPSSMYLPGRSDSLFKIKASYMYADQEALVLHVEKDGSLVLQLPNGNIFSVGRAEVMLPRQPIRGDIVEISSVPDETHSLHSTHHSLHSTHGSLHSSPPETVTGTTTPLVYRIRTDISWDDVVHSHPRRLYANGNTGLAQADTPMRNDIQRAFFDKFAESRGMDPLNPVFWYGVTRRQISKYDNKRYLTMVRASGHKLSTLSTLIPTLYPDIGLVRSRLKTNRPSWKIEAARKTFFDNFACSKGMDSLNPQFWYTVTMSDLIRFKRGYIPNTRRYGDKLSTILMKIYPNIGLKHTQFNVSSQSWKQVKAQVAFFNKFAASKGMDPLNPVFWSRSSSRDLLRFSKGYQIIANEYGGTLPTTLKQLYPTINWQQHQFKESKQSWRTESIRKAFFDNFAASKGMDPLNPIFWHNTTRVDILSYDKRGEGILHNYGGRLSTTLLLLYPDIGLNYLTLT